MKIELDIIKTIQKIVDKCSPNRVYDWRIAQAVLDTLYHTNVITYDEYSELDNWCGEIYPMEAE